MNCKRNPEPSRKLGYGFLLFCSTPFSFGIVLTQKTSIQRITFSGGDFMSVTFQSKKNVTGFRGLAGNLEHGYYIYRNGSKASINATERDFFYFGESWTVSQKDSKFNYKITGGIFTYWNGNHTRPQFLQEIAEKGDLDKLFEGFSDANITKFNETCRNSWDKKPNIQCLVIIAKTKNVTQGESVMAAAEEKHHIYEINHNKPPQFKNNTPTVLNVTFGLNSKILDLKLYVTDDFDDPEEMTYNVVTKLKNYTFNNGSFTWNVGTYLRYSDSSLTFTVNDTLGSPAARQMIIYYCGCENPSQCDFSSFNKNSSDSFED
ncbi:uncharacterized protein LOC123543068 [Mercenaria mercenaria]|uniref:uncharacterized protein LOC123543068 n=1 Tax=Mercenaria mercenaria TaxID=6596 RepID=UPI00234E7CFB|nr:uncharacterized protein LOC123543068 [Mercenaria mercenaria]